MSLSPGRPPELFSPAAEPDASFQRQPGSFAAAYWRDVGRKIEIAVSCIKEATVKVLYGEPVGNLIARHLGGFIASFIATARGAVVGPINFSVGFIARPVGRRSFIARLLPLAIGPVPQRPTARAAPPAARTPVPPTRAPRPAPATPTLTACSGVTQSF
jgi:hypothetical protein